MQIKLFTIPINNVEDYNEEINVFLRTHKVVEMEKHLIQTGTTYSWCFYISYINTTENIGIDNKNTKRVDYMKILDKETFAKFSKLREIRKKIAIENAVSAYIVFTDAELAQIAKMQDLSLKKLKTIKGVGDKKAEKYGNQLIENYYLIKDEKSNKLDTEDNLF